MNTTDSALITRLEHCAEKLGGKRALAAASHISEAQLYRYMSGESSIPHDRLLALALSSAVDPGWLLTGSGQAEGPRPADPRPPFRPELLVQIIQVFEELLVEYEKPFTPRQRARAIAFMYEALRHEQLLLNNLNDIDRARLISALHYLGDETFDDALNILTQLYEHDLQDSLAQMIQENPLWPTILANITSRCSLNWHDSYSGESYFQRVGTQLLPKASSRLLDIFNLAKTTLNQKEISWLDLGCGNGRELSFIFRHANNVLLKGVEISSLGYTHAKGLELSGKLPADTVIRADFRSLPFAPETFDVAYSRMSLFCTPYIPQSESGALEFFLEASRVLKKDGILALSTIKGEGRIYLPFTQYHSEQTLAALSSASGFKIIQLEEMPPPEGGPSYLQRPCWLALFQKL